MMSKLLGVVFLVAGVWVLVYHGFSIPKNHDATLGPIEVSVKQSQRVEIPVWAGVVGIAVGGGLLLWSGKKK